MRLLVVVEQTDDEYVAYCDELQTTASGHTEDEAVENLKAAVRVLLKEHGNDILGEMSRHKVLAVEV